jgi:hypothetical protein
MKTMTSAEDYIARNIEWEVAQYPVRASRGRENGIHRPALAQRASSCVHLFGTALPVNTDTVPIDDLIYPSITLTLFGQVEILEAMVVARIGQHRWMTLPDSSPPAVTGMPSAESKRSGYSLPLELQTVETVRSHLILASHGSAPRFWSRDSPVSLADYPEQHPLVHPFPSPISYDHF